MTVEIYSLIDKNTRTSGKFMTSPSTGDHLPFVAEIGDRGGKFDIHIPSAPFIPITIACGADPGPDTALDCTASLGEKVRGRIIQLEHHKPIPVTVKYTLFRDPDAATSLFASAGVPVGIERTVEILLHRISTE